MKIFFVTGNQRKLREAEQACRPFGIEVEQIMHEINEIQHHDPVYISKHKASEAHTFTGKPTVINDATWKIPALKGFPGGYMKDVAKWFTSEDFLAIMRDKKDRRICCEETIIYKDEHVEKVFNKEFWGEFSKTPRGSGNSIEQVAVFNGKTIAEHHNEGQFSFDPKDYIWHDFAEWYIEYKRVS